MTVVAERKIKRAPDTIPDEARSLIERFSRIATPTTYNRFSFAEKVPVDDAAADRIRKGPIPRIFFAKN